MHFTCVVGFAQQPCKGQTATVLFVLMRKTKNRNTEVRCPALQSSLYTWLSSHRAPGSWLAGSHSVRQTDSNLVFEYPGHSLSLKVTVPSFPSCFRTILCLPQPLTYTLSSPAPSSNVNVKGPWGRSQLGRLRKRKGHKEEMTQEAADFQSGSSQPALP